MVDNNYGGFIRSARDAKQLITILVGLSSLLVGTIAISPYCDGRKRDPNEITVVAEDGLEGIVYTQHGIYYQELNGELTKAWYFTGNEKVEITSESRLWPFYVEDFEKIRKNERRIAIR